MTSKLVVNTIEADTGISSVSFASSISLSSTSVFHFSNAGVDIGADTNISRVGAGNLRLRSETLDIKNLASNKTSAIFSSDGGQTLNFNNSTKFVTTNTGTIVTGIGTFSGRVGVGTNTTAERNSLPAPKAGHLIMNATTNLLEYYNGSAWTPIDTPPTVTSVNNSNITEVQIAAGFDLVITGTNFKSGATATFVGNDGTEHVSPTTTVNSSTQITARVHTSVSNSNEPYDVKIANSSGLSSSLEDAFNINAKPIWTTSSGIVTTIDSNATGNHATLVATDPESDTITYGGTVGGGLSLNTSTGVISGDPTDVSSSTTYAFTASATSSGQVVSRAFSVVVNPAPYLGNCQVWFDPRKFSSLSNNATATSNTQCILPNTTWTVVSNTTISFVSGMSNQGIQASGNGTLSFHTKNQDVTVFDNINNYTWECWVYVGTQDINTWGHIIGKSSFWTSNDGGMHISSTGSEMSIHTSSASASYVDIPANGWHHFVMVRNLSDANCRKLYIDNSLALQDNTGDGDGNHTLNNDCALTIGGSSVGQTNNFATPNYSPANGFKYGHARFYNAALTTSQITQNWNAEKAIYGL